MLSKAEIQDCKTRLNRLGITDKAEVKAVLDFSYSFARLAIKQYEENIEVGQDNPQGEEDRDHLDASQYQRTS